ncbi:MAG: hypothetical protein WBB23_23570 [Desulforhopalus sp.]
MLILSLEKGLDVLMKDFFEEENASISKLMERMIANAKEALYE